MEDREFRAKLAAESPLDFAESLRLDQALDASSSAGKLVSELPDDELSMHWRSQLNEKLAVLDPLPARKKTVFRLWPYAASAVAAASLAIVLFGPFSAKPVTSNPVVQTNEELTIEKALIQAHSRSDDVAILGASAPAGAPKRAKSDEVFDWSKFDTAY